MTHDPFDTLMNSAKQEHFRHCVWLTKNFFTSSDSKIEIMLFWAIHTYHLLKYYSSACEDPAESNPVWKVQRQVQIDNYRVDFLISRRDLTTSIIVECDGHEFHERTKDQAERDRSRDRHLTAKGFRVVRFTGSEIWRDPWKCAEEIDAQFRSIVEIWNEQHG